MVSKMKAVFFHYSCNLTGGGYDDGDWAAFTIIATTTAITTFTTTSTTTTTSSL